MTAATIKPLVRVTFGMVLGVALGIALLAFVAIT